MSAGAAKVRISFDAWQEGLVEPTEHLVEVVGRKLRRIVAAEDLIEGSHDYKAAVAVFESFPRDELFQATWTELRTEVMAVLQADETHIVDVRVVAATNVDLKAKIETGEFRRDLPKTMVGKILRRALKDHPA